MLAVGSTWLWQEGWGHLTLFTFKHKLRHQRQLSFRAPTKGNDYLKPCYFTTASQLGWESSTENALECWGCQEVAHRGHMWHTMHYICLAGIIPYFWPWTENLHSAYLRNRQSLFQPQQQLCKPWELFHCLTQRSEAHGGIQWHGSLPAIPVFALEASTCKQIWHFKSFNLRNPDANSSPAGYD